MTKRRREAFERREAENEMRRRELAEIQRREEERKREEELRKERERQDKFAAACQIEEMRKQVCKQGGGEGGWEGAGLTA